MSAPVDVLARLKLMARQAWSHRERAPDFTPATRKDAAASDEATIAAVAELIAACVERDTAIALFKEVCDWGGDDDDEAYVELKERRRVAILRYRAALAACGVKS